MRVAVVSDIHGNLTALEAVLADMRQTAPDLIFHGGDLADAGASPREIIDRIRDLRWQGVRGNTDEMLATPNSFKEFAAKRPPEFQPLAAIIEEMAVFTRGLLGEDRLAWLRDLPLVQVHDQMALVHAGSGSTWVSPTHKASDAELESAYKSLGKPVVVYGHLHRAFIRKVGGMIVVNSGSVGAPYDGDRSASYLLLTDGKPEIRRVEYDLDQELKLLARRGLPHADWIAKMLASASMEMP